MKAKQRVSALRGAQLDDLAASGGGWNAILLRWCLDGTEHRTRKAGNSGKVDIGSSASEAPSPSDALAAAPLTNVQIKTTRGIVDDSGY